jgi:5-methyltetrahydrofolate--homocysteine methyltransferase
MEAGLALAASHDVPVIALAMDEEGIPDQAPRRIEICKRIAKAAEAANVSAEKLFFDPLVLPVAADITQGMVTLRSLSGIKQAVPGCNTTMGLSNFSHGLKKRRAINAAFLISAITHGLDSAICDPTLPDINRALLLGNLINGRDRHCRRFARAVRKGVFEDTLSK